MTSSGTNWSAGSSMHTTGGTPATATPLARSAPPAGRPAGAPPAEPPRRDRQPGDVMSIEVANESGVEVDESALVSLARHVLDRMHIHPQAELSILLGDAESMEQRHIQRVGEQGR